MLQSGSTATSKSSEACRRSAKRRASSKVAVTYSEKRRVPSRLRHGVELERHHLLGALQRAQPHVAPAPRVLAVEQVAGLLGEGLEGARGRRGRARRSPAPAPSSSCARPTPRSPRARCPSPGARYWGLSTAEAPWAPSTWNQRPWRAQKSATASSGSNAPVAVEPALATTAMAWRPARGWRRVSAPSSASGRSRKCASTGTGVTPAAPQPITFVERAMQ